MLHFLHFFTLYHFQDKHWDECIPKEIPYTIAAEKYKKKEFEGSAQVKAQQDALKSKLQSLSTS